MDASAESKPQGNGDIVSSKRRPRPLDNEICGEENSCRAGGKGRNQHWGRERIGDIILDRDAKGEEGVQRRTPCEVPSLRIVHDERSDDTKQ